MINQSANFAGASGGRKMRTKPKTKMPKAGKPMKVAPIRSGPPMPMLAGKGKKKRGR